MSEGYGKMILGYFGKTPVEPDAELVAIAAEQLGLQPTTRDPREINDEDPTKGLDVARKRLESEGLAVNDENLFIAAALKDKGIAFLKGEGEIGVRKVSKEAPAPTPAASAATNAYQVTLSGKRYDVKLEGGNAIVNGRSYPYEVSSGGASPTSAAAAPAANETITSEMPGKVLKVFVSAGESVSEGQALVLLEALKMEIEVNAPKDGTVAEVPVSAGQQVSPGDVLVALG